MNAKDDFTLLAGLAVYVSAVGRDQPPILSQRKVRRWLGCPERQVRIRVVRIPSRHAVDVDSCFLQDLSVRPNENGPQIGPRSATVPISLVQIDGQLARLSQQVNATVATDEKADVGFLLHLAESGLEHQNKNDNGDDPIHGQQDKRFYQGYYRHYCFLPLYVFCGGYLLCALLRPSDIDGAKYSRVVTKLLAQRIRQVWPNVKIVIRGDSGFCRWKLMRWCENNRVDYVFGLSRNKVLERRIATLMKEAEAGFEATSEKQRLFGEIDYAAGTWDCSRRVTMKAERLLEGPNRRFVVTTLPYKAKQIYDDIYTQRGDMENRIKSSS